MTSGVLKNGYFRKKIKRQNFATTIFACDIKNKNTTIIEHTELLSKNN